jgi:hypothetical protein
VKKPRWSEAELTRLEFLAGEMPLPLLCQSYNTWALKNGYPQRAKIAVRNRLQRGGLSTFADGVYLSRDEVARLTGASKVRITRIIRDRQPRLARSGYRTFVHRGDLAAAAREHPEDWYGVGRDGLFLLFENQELAEEVAARAVRPPWSAGRRAVRCLITGKVYGSTRAAAQAASCGESTVRRCAESGRATSWGQRWEWA